MELTTRKPEYYQRIIDEGVMEDLTEWIIEQFHPSRVIQGADEEDIEFLHRMYEYALDLDNDEEIIDLINFYLGGVNNTMLDLDHEDCERPLVYRMGSFSQN